jgi:hypothetical protein
MNVNQRTRNVPNAKRTVGMPPTFASVSPRPGPPPPLYFLAFLPRVETTSSPVSKSSATVAATGTAGIAGATAEPSTTRPASVTVSAVEHFLHLSFRPMSLVVTA